MNEFNMHSLLYNITTKNFYILTLHTLNCPVWVDQNDPLLRLLLLFSVPMWHSCWFSWVFMWFLSRKLLLSHCSTAQNI